LSRHSEGGSNASEKYRSPQRGELGFGSIEEQEQEDKEGNISF
jgi:hypothetical protein